MFALSLTASLASSFIGPLTAPFTAPLTAPFSGRHLISAAALALLGAGVHARDAAFNAPAAAAAAPAPAEAVCLQRLPMTHAPLARTCLHMRGQQPQPVSNSEPVTLRAYPALAPVVLPQTLATLDQAIASAPSAMQGVLQAARRSFADAHEKLRAGSRDTSPKFMVGVLHVMGQGQAHMGQALDMALDMALATSSTQVALLLPAVQKVREAARLHSVQMLDLARVGVHNGRLAPAMVAIREGDALHLAGNDGAAVDRFAAAFGLASMTDAPSC